MSLTWERSLETILTDKRPNQKYVIKTIKLEYEPNLIFETRHKLKVKSKKYWLNKLTK